jgi:phosphoketolase
VKEPATIPLIPTPLSPDLLEKMDAYWRAANYLTVGKIYLQDNPLLETPLKFEHIKARLAQSAELQAPGTGLERPETIGQNQSPPGPQ